MPTGYDSATVWLVVVLVGVLAFTIHGPFIYLFGRVDDMLPTAELASEYVPAAVFAAFVFPALSAPSSDLAVSIGSDELVADVLATPAAWYTEHALATILVGMDALWVLRFVVWAAVSPAR